MTEITKSEYENAQTHYGVEMSMIRHARQQSVSRGWGKQIASAYREAFEVSRQRARIFAQMIEAYEYMQEHGSVDLRSVPQGRWTKDLNALCAS